jgi:hypothetical protein
MKTQCQSCRAAWALFVLVLALAGAEAWGQYAIPGRLEDPYEPGYRPRSVQGQISLQGPSTIRQPGATQVYSFRAAFANQGVGRIIEEPPRWGSPLFESVDTTTHTILPSLSRTPQTIIPITSTISSNYYITSQPMGAPGTSSSMATAPAPYRTSRDVRLYSPDETFGGTNNTIAPRPLSPKVAITAAAAQSYMNVIANEAEDSTLAPTEITSLAPRLPGRVRDYIVAGEEAFRENEYDEAMENFQLAAELTHDSPETLLSMFHAQYASSERGYYETAAYYLAQTLRSFPELPLVPLAPKEFWGQLRQYGEQLADLEEHCEDIPSDASAQLVLAYFRWFNGDYDVAAQALIQAYSTARDDQTAEAIEIFWDGIAATGLIDPELALPPRAQEIVTPALVPLEDDEDTRNRPPIHLPPSRPDDVPLTP